MLHDVQVVDGLIYLGYWKDGLVILDVGNGIKGGSPDIRSLSVNSASTTPSFTGRAGWPARIRSFAPRTTCSSATCVSGAVRSDGQSQDSYRGFVHIVDVSDILNPEQVADYEVPEGGAHNMWVENDVMYIGYYGGGARVVDVSGELRGNLTGRVARWRACGLATRKDSGPTRPSPGARSHTRD